jgi:hypothetical protein
MEVVQKNADVGLEVVETVVKFVVVVVDTVVVASDIVVH